LHGILGRRRVRVNSFHHQAIRKLGRGLRAVAWATDDVVEGVEAPGSPFLVGVQWHAECLVERRPGQAALFASFVDAARQGERGGLREARAA
jgi:putative glutamine amidotransferase